MSVDAEALDMAKSLGHMAAPVVIITETGENWSGFRPERIAALSV
jgi:glutaredoxin-like protein NrdH